MDEGLGLVDVFQMPIPELVFGNTLNDVIAPLETVYHHAAVTSLLPHVPGFGTGTRFVPSDSNEVAYEAMVRHGERAGCVSNQTVFEFHNRPSLITLRTAREMSWHVFADPTKIVSKASAA